MWHNYTTIIAITDEIRMALMINASLVRITALAVVVGKMYKNLNRFPPKDCRSHRLIATNLKRDEPRNNRQTRTFH